MCRFATPSFQHLGTDRGEVCTTIEEQPATHVVEALTLIGKLHLALIEDFAHASGLIAWQIIGGNASTLTHLIDIAHSIVQLTGTASHLSEVEQHLSIAQFDELCC